MTRYKVEIEIAVQDNDTTDAIGDFRTQLEELTGQNIPGRSGWAVTKKPEYERVYDVFDLDRPKDPRWQAILDKVDEIVHDGIYVASMRGAMMSSKPSGSHKGSLYCEAHFGFRDPERDAIGEDVYLIEATEHYQRKGQIEVRLHGPWTDSHDEYWTGMVGNPNAIITPDWTHRTVAKDDPKAVAAGGGGHGGAEFRFELSAEDGERFHKVGLTVIDHDTDDNTKKVLVTHNCGYQGVIPPKHRHLFKVNAEMVQGFNPGRYV